MPKTIKSPKLNTLRSQSINKLDWGEENRLYSTMKRLVSSFDVENQAHSAVKKNKIKLKCPCCSRSFYVSKGKKLPKHKKWFSNEFCSQVSSKPYNLIKKEINETIIDEIIYEKGESILFQPYPWHTLFDIGRDDLIEAKIEKIYLMSDNSIKFKLSGYKKLIPTFIFREKKNLLKI